MEYSSLGGGTPVPASSSGPRSAACRCIVVCRDVSNRLYTLAMRIDVASLCIFYRLYLPDRLYLYLPGILAASFRHRLAKLE
ncbi:unnamed protein product [Spodoptera littoralis]|uniref:Uncharacterized protein n=1 Tax=Spodoptera littoralis TaxID=7109 RepID=A0A9P0HVU1_SPOLI|nr:unnamed protein product [Spodoptera littoralis]CAH1635437.1 unnamed protein product [Spodoptera littoralis]